MSLNVKKNVYADQASITLVAGCIFSLAGIVITTIGIALMVSTIRFLPGSVSANGTIISCFIVESRYGSSYSSSCQPTVSFETQSGQQIIFKSSSSSSTFSEGDTVTVRYHPSDPQDARIYSWEEQFGPSIVVGLGLVALIIGLFNFVRGMMRGTNRAGFAKGSA